MMTQNLSFRQLAPDQLPLILQLLREAATAIQNKGLDQWNTWLQPTDDNISWLQAGLLNNEFFSVITGNQETAGMFRLSYSDLLYWGKQDKPAGYVHSLVVRKEFSGHNLGTTILRMIEAKLLEEGYHLLRLDCNAGNQWLCRYYESQGFTKAGQVKMPHALNNLYEKPLAGNYE
ncbi:GNAT family N-acetyltransferase [Chitinophaga sp. Mgbs1]|uniref:GNAT family N-acetyltransferase n=1 Tax=Chitinophaga solisilvae TaxID=1233460 RepID=A0A3S1D2B9_9BACT|nr:GNAT family N-acetyltransferase [Chitinophaga solisilvae]